MAKQPKKLLSNFGSVASNPDKNVDIKGKESKNNVENDIVNDNSNVNVNDNVNKYVNSNINNNVNDNKNVTELDNKNNHELNHINNNDSYHEDNNQNESDLDSLVDNIRVNDPKRKYSKSKTVLDVLVDQKKAKKQMAFYLDQDVTEAIDRLNTLGKGRIKSTFVNEVLREALKREGLL